MNDLEKALADHILTLAMTDSADLACSVGTYKTLCEAYKLRVDADVLLIKPVKGTPGPKSKVDVPLEMDYSVTKDVIRACFRAKAEIISKTDDAKQKGKVKFTTDAIALMAKYGAKTVTAMDEKHLPEFYARFKLLGPDVSNYTQAAPTPEQPAPQAEPEPEAAAAEIPTQTKS